MKLTFYCIFIGPKYLASSGSKIGDSKSSQNIRLKPPVPVSGSMVPFSIKSNIFNRNSESVSLYFLPRPCNSTDIWQMEYLGFNLRRNCFSQKIVKSSLEMLTKNKPDKFV
uniref:Uncharacterized protein n=1 Tax=Romanomermis culicivorax TaxID=13658 RepID=A0A915I970_ROMCU